MEVLSLNKNMLLKMIMMAMMWSMAKSVRHDVGGDDHGWNTNINMTKWSSDKQFHLNEWLFFGYDRHFFSVLEVNKTSYENCIDSGFIKNITTGVGREVFQLSEAKTYYFISGGGFCQRGVKVAIDVNEHVAPAPQPTSHKSGTDALNIQIYHSLVVLILIFMCTNFWV